MKTIADYVQRGPANKQHQFMLGELNLEKTQTQSSAGKRNIRSLVVIMGVLFCAVALHAQSGTATWTNTGSDDWMNTAGWSIAAVPNTSNASAVTIIANGGTAVINAGDATSQVTKVDVLNGALLINSGSLSYTNWFIVGGGDVAESGTGALVMTGSSVLISNSTNPFIVGSINSNSSSSGITATGSLVMQDNASINLSNSTFYLGDTVNSIGIVNISGNASLTTTGNLEWDNGTVTMAGSGALNVATANLGDNAQAYSWNTAPTNPVLNVSLSGNSTITASNGIHIGQNGAQATVTMSGSSYMNIIGGELDIASSAGQATGTLIMQDNAAAYVQTANVSIGNYNGNASLIMSGSSNLDIMSSSKGLYVVNGGTATQATITLNDYATIEAGGNLSLVQSGTGVAIMTLNNNSSVTVNGGMTLVNGSGTAILNLNDNSSLILTSELDIGQNQSAVAGSVAQININGNAVLNAAGGIVMAGKNGQFVNGNGVSQLNIDGGTLATTYIRNPYASNPSVTNAAININNGTIQALQNTPNVATTGTGFFYWTSYGAAPYVNIQSGGMTFDTQSYNVQFNAYLHTDGTSTGGGFTKKGSGTLTLLSGGNYTGTTSVQAGTLIISGTALTGNGTVSLSTGVTLSVNGLTQSFDMLTVLGNATLDFGTGSTTISFADSSSIAWNGILTLTDFIVGTSELRFGEDGTALTSAQLADISLAGYGSAYLNSSGYVQFNVIPEPSVWGLLIAGIVPILGLRYHRQRDKII